MRRISILIGACLASVFSAAIAQEDMTALPVEMFGCTFKDEMGMADIERANRSFNNWADRNDVNSVSSLMLTPHFFSPDQEFELIGMDIWESGADMGAGVTKLMADDSAVEDYVAALDCPAHALFALVGIKPPQGDPQGGLLEFTDCTLRADHSADDGIAAATAIANMMTPWGLNDAHAVLFPVSGESPDADYTFKWITYYPSVAAFGGVFDHFAAGAAREAGAIVDPVMSCNNSRMYDVSTVRTAGED